MTDDALVPGFFIGGFECSSHRLQADRRLDLPASTRHVEFADADYLRLADAGIVVARDGFSWHRAEPSPGRRDFAAVVPLVRAARRAGVKVVWDLMHFGWPDGVDPWTPGWIGRFAALTRDFMTMLADEGDGVPWISPVNEMSFLSWAGGDIGMCEPFGIDRGFELKCQLVRATIAAIETARDIEPHTRVVVHDPAFNVLPVSERLEDIDAAEASRRSQFQACDMLAGRIWPQLGGRADYLDVIGVNYYPWNQWVYGSSLVPGPAVPQDDARYRPLATMLAEWSDRYGRPIYIGETGCEGDARTGWLRYVCDQVAVAQRAGTPVEGACLYPIVDFPGWSDDRPCENGLWGYADDRGHRIAHAPLAAELALQQRRFANGLQSQQRYEEARDAHAAPPTMRPWTGDPAHAANDQLLGARA